MATLKDISKHLGLSVTQVSRAMNNHSDVSKATRDRVQAAAKELGYAVNMSARSLVTGRSGLVSLIRPGGLSGPADITYLETISGLSNEFFKRGLQFVLHMVPIGEDALPIYHKAAASGSFDGFILTDLTPDDPRVALLTEMGVPFVAHGRSATHARHSYFDIDNFDVARQHVKHLAKLGHKRIALLNGPQNYAYSKYRLDGYLAALGEMGLAYDPDLVVSTLMTEGHGMVLTARLFEDGPARPTALICGNILLAKGAYKAFEAMDMRIPNDVSVVAHDDVIHDIRGSAFYPSLTVTKSPFSESWTNLADILCLEIQGKTTQKSQRLADVEFIARASSGPVKTKQ
ncbi:MAG: substrate-binding domain-containing protein [Roseibium sp.]